MLFAMILFVFWTLYVVGNLVHEIERSKPSLEDDVLLKMDKVQNNLKLFCVKVSNQSYGYSAMFDNANSEIDMREDKLNSLISERTFNVLLSLSTPPSVIAIFLIFFRILIF